MTDRGNVDPNLVSAPGLELARDEACRAEPFVNSPVRRGVPSALPAHDRHLLPMARITADRAHDLSGGCVESAPNEREIFALQGAGAAMIGEEFGQAPMRRVGLGDNQKPGCVLVEPMHDSGALDAADAREARPAMPVQRVDQRAGGMARRRMDDKPGRLVDYDQMLIFVNDRKGYGLARDR